ncbi:MULTISPECIES: extracellular solute-binding protein [Eisenbergiella]|uniref:Extracellular solute-binding protein n=1 Tax=Eisenbergiella porci TaxID=2652274 RepID=A0A6N7WBZ1_9FIRM|nr:MULTISPECIES: extracellular solute-binding protein [Eisenbergiella]MDY2652546.1 extracellular solute-binding protein [Eisenbergiella porci]MSS88193.1 extracellular solute-binding protein [Eisenbergiella porci]
MKKKIVSLLLTLTMAAGLISGCGSSSSSGAASTGSGGQTAENMEEAVAAASSAADSGLTKEEQEAVDAGILNLDGTLPIIKDPAAFEEKYGKISALIVNTADRVVPVKDLEMCKVWFEDTGIEFDWQAIPSEGAQEKINLMLASGEELPDVFWNFGDGKSGNIVVQYADQDIFLPTEGLINEYMPNLKKILDDSENYWSEITAPDGHTYGFPYIEEMYGLVLTGGPLLINKTWLDEVGKEVPTTVDEWVDCLKAFRDGGDLNGNGAADEIPMATWFGATDTFGSYNMFYRFTGAFGCADSYCGGNAYADHLRLIDGKVTFTAQDEAFRKTAEFFNMLYNEGLIWNGSFEADESASYKSSLIKEDVARIGCFGTWTDQEITNLDVHDEYVAIPRLQGEAGMTGFENNYSELQDSSNTAITTTCKFPHVIAKFVDYMVGDPAISIQSNWGAEGYNYVKDDNGILRTPLDEQGRYVAQTEYTNFGEARVNSTTCRGSMIVLDEYYETVAGYAYDAVQLLENQKTNGKEDIMAENDTIPRVMMTTDELSRLAQIQPTISDIVDRYINQWVTGGVTDDNWNAYLGELQSAGVEDLVSIYQSAVDRSSK